jgi:DNA-binding beta-propeller fold protein YncE
MIRGAGGVACAALVLVSMACATPARKQEAPVYFPPAPELPRIQFLVSIKGLKDVEQQSSFNRFVVGERQDVRLDKPYGVAMHDGRIYVCDTNASVVVFDLKAKRYGPMPGATGPGRLVQPINISIDAHGTKYVADPGRGQVVTFDRDDAYQNAYGTPGAWRPVDAVAWEDRIYVADPANGLVKVFDKTTGGLVRSIGDSGEPQERLDRPTNLAFDNEGYLYVTDAGRFQVIKFDRDGHFKTTFGQPGDNLGHFARPKGIALDRDGRLYAVDASFNNVQVFNREGRLLMFFGEGGETEGQLLLPAKVSIDYDDVPYFQQYAGPQFRIEYLLLVTSQFGERSISVFGYGAESGQKYPTDDELLKAIDERRRHEQEQQPPPHP